MMTTNVKMLLKKVILPLIAPIIVAILNAIFLNNILGTYEGFKEIILVLQGFSYGLMIASFVAVGWLADLLAKKQNAQHAIAAYSIIMGGLLSCSTLSFLIKTFMNLIKHGGISPETATVLLFIIWLLSYAAFGYATYKLLITEEEHFYH